MNTDVELATTHISIDAAAFPVVTFTFNGAPDRAEFTAFLDACSRLFDRLVPFVAVVDARSGGVLGHEQILEAAAWLEREDGRRRDFVKGIALVLPGPVQRAVLAAIVRITSVGPHKVFADVESAAAWAVKLAG